jgi:hypothetical protein
LGIGDVTEASSHSSSERDPGFVRGSAYADHGFGSSDDHMSDHSSVDDDDDDDREYLRLPIDESTATYRT